MARLRTFISSVQKELADERMAVQILLSTDAFLQKHTVPRLFEYTPAPLTPNKKGYLDLLATCNVCLVILGREYGAKNGDTGLSATHEEYRLAKKRGLPILPCVKGDRSFARDPETNDLFEEIKRDGYTYSRLRPLRISRRRSGTVLSSTSRRRMTYRQRQTTIVTPPRILPLPTCSNDNALTSSSGKNSTKTWPGG